MALPADGLLSIIPQPSVFLAPRNVVRVPLIDRCRGGIALNDASKGLNVFDWTYTYNTGTRAVLVEAIGNVAQSSVFILPADAKEIAGSFDTNMQPIIGWTTIGGVAAFRWFDPIGSAFTVITLTAGSSDVRIVIDDVRTGQVQLGAEDTIITYLRAGSLYYRKLRDRFVSETLLKTGLTGYKIGQFGPALKLRLQWQLYKPIVG